MSLKNAWCEKCGRLYAVKDAEQASKMTCLADVTVPPSPLKCGGLIRIRMVAGLLFSERSVALITKSHLSWQRGRLNGVGGHVEVGETLHQAMSREFREKSSHHVDDWRQFAILVGAGWRVDWFASESIDALQLTLLNLLENGRYDPEPIDWYPIDAIPSHAMDNIPWLVAMARSPQLIVHYVEERP